MTSPAPSDTIPHSKHRLMQESPAAHWLFKPWGSAPFRPDAYWVPGEGRVDEERFAEWLRENKRNKTNQE